MRFGWFTAIRASRVVQVRQRGVVDNDGSLHLRIVPAWVLGVVALVGLTIALTGNSAPQVAVPSLVLPGPSLVSVPRGEMALLPLEAAVTTTTTTQPEPIYTPPPTTVPVTFTPQTGGPHSDAWWMGVAVCEQGGRNDPYYGYFSFMDGSSAGKSWEEQVAMGNALLARVGHEIGPWAESCVRAGYRSSPSG